MNDHELITAVRESFTGVRSATEVERIVSRGRAVRARRRAAGGAAALGTAATAAIAVSVVLPAGHPAVSYPAAGIPVTSRHPAAGPGVVRLAAWTVTRQADGTIQVTFREATDAARLQHTLRADGVPASVTFTGRPNPACHATGGPVASVFDMSRFAGHIQDAYKTQDALVIRPSALPSGVGVQISASGTPGAADNFQLQVGLVKASPRCTGS
jgi:hypothetical protein